MKFVANLGSWMSVVCEICFLFLVLVDFVTYIFRT